MFIISYPNYYLLVYFIEFFHNNGVIIYANNEVIRNMQMCTFKSNVNAVLLYIAELKHLSKVILENTNFS